MVSYCFNMPSDWLHVQDLQTSQVEGSFVGVRWAAVSRCLFFRPLRSAAPLAMASTATYQELLSFPRWRCVNTHTTRSTRFVSMIPTHAAIFGGMNMNEHLRGQIRIPDGVPEPNIPRKKELLVAAKISSDIVLIGKDHDPQP